ncbi:MAG TPA: hypothetical protein VHO70_18045 [Chitinispirillaceae bacterium]|nr:hypothetical protein [Chitinispirillaceae bacterium]
MDKIRNIVILGLLLAGLSNGMGKKTLMHIISIPLLDGAGIYSGVQMLQTESANNKASAITTLSLLGVNAGLGATAMFAQSENMAWVRTTHRVVGFLVTGASIWMAVSAGVDDEIRNGDKIIAGGFAGLTAVPLIMFSF